MIGQKRLRDLLGDLIDNGQFPRFCILVGAAGSGKKTMADWIAGEMLKWHVSQYKLPDVKVDTIRQMINTSYQAAFPVLYCIYDADSMSTAAKNSLLKVTEEPPNNAYFLMTIEDEDYTLDTIKSRASIFLMDSYSCDEIMEYAGRSAKLNEKESQIIKELCDVPGDVDIILNYNAIDFYGYVEKVVDNIAEVEGANAFKISEKLAVKQDSEGYDVKLFLRAFMAICVSRMQEDPLRYAGGISITSKYISQLGIKGASKQMLLDTWLLEIRKRWMR